METVQTVRIDHGSVPASAMAYSQRQPTNHRPSQPELYKPSRSPIPSATQSRYPYPGGGSAQGPGGPPGAPPPSARYMPTPPSYQTYREYRPRLQLLHPGPARTPPGPYGDKEYIGSNKLFSTNASRTPPFGEYNRVGRITILSPGSPRDSPYGERDYRPHRISLLQADPTRTSPYGDEYRQPRISLLHPEYAIRPRMEQAQSTASQLPPPPTNASQPPPPAQPPSHQTGQNSNVLDGTQPFKKIRLQEHKEQMPPLRIDTRDQPGSYNPQVEAISPTLPDNHLEDQAFKRKDELLQDISKVDREIAKTEQKIAILKKKQAELEELASKPASKLEVEEVSQPKHQSLAQKIYADNRKKAQAAHSLLDSLGPKVEWPIYNQPSDTSVYHENKRKHQTFKRRLLEYFKKRHQDKEARENYLTQTYSKLMQEWLRKVDKIESSQKRKAKEAKNREFFEKVFPELRKQREDKERFNRVGARIKSEADLEEIMDGLQEQEMEDKKMRSYAVIPPILLDARQRKLKYVNNNGHILDMELEHKERQNLNVWTSAENEIFKEKYLQHPKNFGVIASYLDRKSVQDCVQHYYLTKKTENYKQLLRKSSRQRTRASRNNPQKVNNAGNNPIVDGLSTGVTTRLQREQQQKTVQVIEQQRQQQQTQQSQQQTQQQPQQQSTQQQQEMSVTTASTTVTTTTTTTNTTVPVTSSSTTNPTTNSTTNPTNSSTTTSSTTTTVTSTNTTTVTTSTSNTTSSGTNSNNNNTTSNTNSNNNVINSANKSSGGAADEKAKVVTINSSNIIVSTSTAASGVTAVSSPSVVTSASEQNAATPPQQQQTQTQPPQVTNCDQQEPMIVDNTSNSDPNNTNAENKKKKERRKDKDNASMETSDDENPEGQDKTIHQGQCVVCKAQLGPQLQSRPLAASQASQYGLREEDITSGSRVCNTCRCKCVRSRYTHCPLPTCPNARGRVKRLRSLPQRWQEISSDMKDPIIAEFQIPQGVTKCCSACFNRISRRLGAQEDWPEEEVNRLKMYLLEIGAVWTAIGEGLGRPGHQVKAFYSANRKRYNLEACLGDRKPQLTDEEDSGSSTSSCEEPMRERHSSDTASAESPPAQPEQPQGGPQRKEDYDSSATETADEGQTPDHYQGSATITAVNSDGQRPSNSPPMTVKELMSNVIELQLMKNPSGMCQLHPPVSGVTPTISSILNIDSPDVTITREYNLNTQQPPTSRPDLATLVTPLIAATITPVPPAGQQEPTPSPREQEQLVVLPVEGREPEPLTLDLSLKKPRGECPPPAHKHNPIHRTPESNYIQYHHERKSPAVYVPTVSRAPSKLPSPKMANPKAGSITLGTPIINQQQRYSEGLLRQMTPEPKMGSITQGTPIHMPPHVQDKRMYDYYNKRNQPPQNVANYPGTYRQPFNFSVEQRQIIMNDYITSQQMLGTRRGEKPTGQPPQNYYPARSPRRTPPLPQPQRQGVIQRHTRPQPGHYPPGHEALSSLVDVAVQQPSLPVPATPHEGLGKTIADHLSEPHRFQLAQMQQQQMRQQRLQEEHRVQMAYREQAQQQAARQSRNQSSQSSRSCDSSTVTAASLIDAIITHQINQGNEGGGREVVQNNREPPRPGDRLFQSFARDQPEPPPPQNNGEQRSPSVISVDLDAEPTQNKSMTVKDITDSVISMDFNQRPNVYYHQDNVAEWKRRIQKEDANKQRSTTPQTDERQIIRIAQPQQQQQKYQPVSPPGNNHWPEQDFHRYQTQSHPQSHISALDYVKHRIVKAMLSEDDTKRDNDKEPHGDKAPDSPGEMVIDEDKYEVKYQTQNQNFAFPYSALNVSHVNSQTSNKINSEQQITNNDNNIQNPNEPKPLLSANYEPLSDED